MSRQKVSARRTGEATKQYSLRYRMTEATPGIGIGIGKGIPDTGPETPLY
ncbi:hypothetical protein [Pontibacter indicus]|nr:hypothetical protein [Pontibacter indicus]